MCCDNCGEEAEIRVNGKWVSRVNGECQHCGSETVDGIATDICNYSPQICTECNSSPCDGSC